MSSRTHWFISFIIVFVLSLAWTAPATASPPADDGDQRVAQGSDDDKAAKRRERRQRRRERRRREREEQKRKEREREAGEDVAGTSDEAPTTSGTSTPDSTPATPGTPQGQATPVPDKPRPWAEGVSQADQDRAVKLFQEGNTYLEQSLYKAALEAYDKAIEHWNHPAIQYNRTLSLINMDRTIDAYKAVGQALKYGPEALEEEEYKQAANYKRLIEHQVAVLEIKCEEPGAQVTLNGQPLFTAPGKREELMLIGRYEIIARKPGHIDATEIVELGPGPKRTIELELPTVEEMTIEKRRWSAWKPWAVVGGGVVAGLIGGGLHLRALDNADSFNNNFAELCPSGCADEDEASTIGTFNTAERQQDFAVAAYAVGGAALVTGLVLVYLNQPKKYRIDEMVQEPAVSVVPTIAPGGAGIQARISF